MQTPTKSPLPYPDQQSAENIEAMLETAAAKAASKQTPGELPLAFSPAKK